MSDISNHAETLKFLQAIGHTDLVYVRCLSPKNTPMPELEARGMTYPDKKDDKVKKSTVDGYINLQTGEMYRRYGKNYKPVNDGWEHLHDLNQQGYGIYFVVHHGGTTEKAITHGTCLFHESDLATFEQQQLEIDRITLEFGKPTAVVKTRKSLHAYWASSEIISIENLARYQRRWLQFSNCDDQSLADLPQLMRLPNFDHVAWNPETQDFDRIQCKLIRLDEVKYPLSEFDRVLPELETELLFKPSISEPKESDPTDSDMRSFAPYLIGFDDSGEWIRAKCPAHDGVSSNSLHINSKTGGFKCQSEKCDSSLIYNAAKAVAVAGGHQVEEKRKKDSEGNPPELWIADDFTDAVLKDQTLFDTTLKKYWQYDGSGVWENIDDDYMFKKCLDYLRPIVPAFNPRYADNVIRFAKSKILISKLDEPSNLEYVPFKNGVLNLTTKELLPHTPDNKFTWQLPRNYSPEKTDWTKIKKFISDSFGGNEQLIDLAIAISNAVLIGRSDLQMSFVLKGSGRNGKGAFMKLLTSLVGEVNTRSSSMKTLNENNFEYANYFKKRLVIMPDEDKQAGSVSIFKKVVGGDKVDAVRKYEHGFEFQFKGIIVIAANQPIFVSEKGVAVQDRLAYLPFDKYIEAKDRIDLEPVFTREMEAFTNYLLSLDDDWVGRTINNAKKIKAVKDLSWDIMVESDSVAAFYDDKLIAGTERGDTINSSFVYELYKYYCEKSGLKAKAQNTFGKQIIEIAKSREATVTRHRSKNGIAFIGIRARVRGDVDDKIQELDPEVTYIDWGKHVTDGKLDREWR